MNKMQVDLLLSYGINCRDINQELKKMSIQEVYAHIQNKDTKLEEETRLLRKVYNYSKDRYREMKTRLPYISCSHFTPNHRKFENFAYSVGWILDIDMEIKMEESLKQNILSDQRIAFAYTSPNGMGLKLLFIFDEKMEDKTSYTSAYRAFTHEFGLKYGILDKMDLKNCDVSRISFLCHDKNSTLRDDYIPINYNQYVVNPPNLIDTSNTNEQVKNLSPTIYRNILEKLGSRPKPVQSKPFVPHQLILALEPLTEIMSENGITIVSHEEVQYGIKLFGRHQNDQGEIIIYYGKKGWSVVSSAKKGLHHDLNEIMKQIAENFLYTTLFLP